MDLVTPEVSTAEVKLFVNHYGQGLGGLMARTLVVDGQDLGLDQPKVLPINGVFYVKWGTLIPKIRPPTWTN